MTSFFNGVRKGCNRIRGFRRHATAFLRVFLVGAYTRRRNAMARRAAGVFSLSVPNRGTAWSGTLGQMLPQCECGVKQEMVKPSKIFHTTHDTEVLKRADFPLTILSRQAYILGI